MHIIWTIIIGFIAGVIAKFITPGKNEPSGFILTTILGIVGSRSSPGGPSEGTKNEHGIGTSYVRPAQCSER